MDTASGQVSKATGSSESVAFGVVVNDELTSCVNGQESVEIGNLERNPARLTATCYNTINNEPAPLI
jgi:hypothetical protein